MAPRQHDGRLTISAEHPTPGAEAGGALVTAPHGSPGAGVIDEVEPGSPFSRTAVDQTAANPYDRVRYAGQVLAQAHPNRLATIATLLGMKPANVARCRVLEVGCGDGMNLIAVALGLPEASCIGIDLAASAIHQGRQVIQELDLRNIALYRRDMMDVDRGIGEFDFIIAHGVYSWVPPEVREKLLSICKENLAADGVAYVSYNTYPGGHACEMAREMMRYHVSEFREPGQCVAQARALMEFLADQARTDGDAYRMVLKKESERIASSPDSLLFHDDLAEHNAPVYFHQFIEQAGRRGLKYLSEAHFKETQSGIFPPKVVDVLNRMSDSLIAKEQYLDFLKGRRFRQTLLCHEECQLDQVPRPERMACFHVASPSRAKSAALDPQSAEVVTFDGPANSSLSTNDPLIKAAVAALGAAWPQAVHFSRLLGAARAACGRDGAEGCPSLAQDARTLGEVLLRAYAGGIIELHVEPPRFVSEPGQRPVASPLARLQSRQNGKVPNLRHYNIPLEDPLGRYLLGILDGSRDRAALLEELVGLVESGELAVRGEENPVQEPQQVRELLAGELERQLVDLAERALLLA
jgi:methyltransferase-like protein/cyclopropane fatty-acyl-phospholipid synthase-like methyltransferase